MFSYGPWAAAMLFGSLQHVHYTHGQECTFGATCTASIVDQGLGCSDGVAMGICLPWLGAAAVCIITGNEDITLNTCSDNPDCTCNSGIYAAIDNTGTPVGICVNMLEDPHMHGFRGQHIDWAGVDGAWYAIISDGVDNQMSVRLTAPLATDFPDRQLITGLAIKYKGGHSIVIEIKDPYTTDTEGCPSNWFAPCLSENSLRITVDGDQRQTVPTDRAALPGEAFLTAVNLPAECQPYGGDLIWADRFAEMSTQRRLRAAEVSFTEWVSTWSKDTAAPTWCDKFIDEVGVDGALKYGGKHTVFKVETPALTVRLHQGTNHQGGEVLDDGRVLPELEFWQMDMHLEGYDLNTATVTGVLGETMRPVLDVAGVPIMSGLEAMRGNVEDYRISGPLASDFHFFHE